MPITISDSSLTIDGSKSTWTVPSPVVFMGEIVRLYNSSSTTQTYNYTGIDGITTTATVSATTSSYILVKSGSATDSWNETTQIASIKLFITSSQLGNQFSEQLITTAGGGTWTKPTGVTQVVVECWGGGGAGGGVTLTDFAGGAGAGGQYARKYITYSSPSENVSYTVGTGGTGGTGNGPSGNETNWNTNQVVAKGGNGGELGDSLSGNGGTGSFDGGVGDVVYKGGDGAVGSFLNFGGPGGGGAGSTGNGNNGNSGGPIEQGAEQKEYGGAGAAPIAVSSNGLPGNNYGAGGGGALKLAGANRSGGNGAQGLIRILYR